MNRATRENVARKVGREIRAAATLAAYLCARNAERSNLRGACYVSRDAAAVRAAQRDVRARRRRCRIRVAHDFAGAGWTAEGHSVAVVRDELKGLGGVVGGWSGLAHWLLQSDTQRRPPAEDGCRSSM